ncbi:MAG: hypothetical protein ACKO96_23010, partial [Flammeovirgaceae bacterium]
KLRAKCKIDVVLFIQSVFTQLTNFQMTPIKDVPDVHFEFETDLAADEIKFTLEEIPDSHVMIESLRFLAPSSWIPVPYLHSTARASLRLASPAQPRSTKPSKKQILKR